MSRLPFVRPRPRRLCAAAGLAAACGVAACQDEQLSLDQLQRFQATEELGGEADTAPVWRPTPRDPVTVRLTVAPSGTRGEPIALRVHLFNGSPRPVSVGLGQNQDVEVVVARLDRPARQGALFGPMQLQRQRPTRGAVVTDPIRPGRDSTFEVLWPQTDDMGHRVPPGRYRVRAVVNAQLVARQRMWTGWDTVTVAP